MVEFDASNNEEQVRAAENIERNGKMEVPHPPLSSTGKLQTASLKQVRNAYKFQTIRLTNICFESYILKSSMLNCYPGYKMLNKSERSIDGGLKRTSIVLSQVSESDSTGNGYHIANCY